MLSGKFSICWIGVVSCRGRTKKGSTSIYKYEFVGMFNRYEEFHNSYGALMVEIVRRHQVHQNQERIVTEFMQKMQASYNDEMSQRAVFSEQHGKFLPVDLCPTFAVSDQTERLFFFCY